MDECCIKFEVDIPTKIGHHEMNYKTFKMLNRKKGNHSEVVVRAYESYQMSAKYNNTKLIEEAFAKVDELFVKIPRTPIGVFKILKEYSGFTNMELEVETGLSKATIDSYLYSEDCKYKKYTVIRLLLAMNIPPKVSLTVLQLCGCVIVPMNKEDQWLEHVLILRWTYKLEENVKFLNDLEIYI